MVKGVRNVSLEQYALIILRKLADATQVRQAVYVRGALDAFFVNNITELKGAGINKTFILKELGEDPAAYDLIPERLKELLGLPPSITEEK